MRHVGEGAVAIVVIKHVRIAGEAAWAAHHRNPLPLAGGGLSGRAGLCRIELDVIADKQVEVSVAIVIQEGATGAPAYALIVDSGFASHIGEGAIAVVVKQNVVSPEATKEIVPAVVVEIPDADAGLPAGAAQP